MERLKSLNLTIRFQKNFSTHPVIVRYQNKPVEKIDLVVNKFDQTEKITFEGFSYRDADQKIDLIFEYNGKRPNLDSISIFQMSDNKFVDNKSISKYTNIFFNGELTITFTKEWLKHHVLAGANLGQNYCSWDDINIADEEVFCVGDSFTYGEGVDRKDTWPSILGGNTYNSGSIGLSHDGCLKNVKYILENSSRVKQIICLLPPDSRKLFEFEFLGSIGSIPISVDFNRDLPVEFLPAVRNIKKSIIDGNITDDWIATCEQIANACAEKNVECWMSTWDSDLIQYIPSANRLPTFPNLDRFPERASDGGHPHRKHYELFVNNIRPFVDNNAD